MENIFVLIYRFFKKHRIIFWCSFGLAFLIPALIASRIHLEEDITSIIPKDEKTRALNEVFQQSRLLDKMILTVSATDSSASIPDSLVTFSDELVQSIHQAIPGYVTEVSHKVDEEASYGMLNTINDHLPVFLEEKDYATIDSLISEAGVKTTLEKNFRILTAPSGLALKQFIAKDPAGISNPALKKLQLLQYDQHFELYDSHILTRDLKKLVLFISPAYPKNNTGKNAIFLQGLDRLLDSLQHIHPGIRVDYFGGTAVAVGNALQLRKDTMVTQGITILFLIIFIAAYFRRGTAPVLVLVPALFGAIFSLACIALFKGSISVIALGTGSVILGIAVNYSLHVLNHYRHQPDMELVLRDLSHPMTIGSITTIGGFLCMQWVESEMLRDLGLFGAFSLIGASVCSLVFLPQLIGKSNSPAVAQHGWLDRFAAYKLKSNKKLVWLILALTVFFAAFVGKVAFEPDMNRMNYMPEKLKQAEKEMNQLNAFALQSVYVVSPGKDLQAALRRNEKVVGKLEELTLDGVVKKYSGLSAVLVSDSLQRLRISRWNAYWTFEKKSKLLSNLQQQGAVTGFKAAAFQPVTDLLNKVFVPVDDSTSAKLATGILDNFIIKKDGQVKVLTLVKTTPEQKAAVYAAFDHEKDITVLDMQYITSRLVDMVRNDFNSISWMAAGIVFIVLLVSFGRIELTLISFVPMLITWIWILGIMGLAGIPFNIVNIIISALIFGLGDDYSLFTIDGLLQEYKTGKKNLDSFKSSILLSAITTIAGLGVLIFAKHPSLKSIALIAITGILCVVLISQVLIPVLFRIIITNRTAKGKQPLTAWHTCTSVFAFTYFTVGALILSVAAVLLLKLNPFAGEKSKYAYHFLLSKFTKSLMYIMVNVKKTIINPGKEQFDKPSVIISNHQSFLDILSLVMLHPKIILITNDWVWRSPVFGFVVRMADYFPVSIGVENNLEKLTEKFRQGYSIAIFPEGTRSPDGTIKRFHKGAFFLAEHLKADLLPVLLLGTGHTMGKGDYLLKDGHIIIEVLPRISLDNTSYGTTYAERTKLVSRYFKNIYNQRKESNENGNWFRNDLIANYRYKGPFLEWYIRIKARLENNYQVFLNEVPAKGKLLDLGCGYGPMSYMLHLKHKELDITGVDYDEEKILTASHCFSKDQSIRFLAKDALHFEFDYYDAIIIADMLHYLQHGQQEALLEKCMQHILPGGKIILREGNSEMEQAHRRTKLTEFFSTKVMGFNKSDAGRLYYLSASMIKSQAEKQGFHCRELKDSNFTSNFIYILERKETAHAT
ncbi:trifunctional MMPL family transporter/lysophospholipid acyltransferase/class I SAM-dependent methyltransferase [Flavihumibacter profundi]|uniref:trifunctional MMPL family transporter/lysophospholipid acyltransferase/class I SAM-dependent methyltransferase n=1 Tax=Flavihumibacter profundi TaxID=2716883 RepID=UPI001CC5E01C|nr:trifunctional MMPL family transporter/lysophospholipid acyltransferase/class I SAM-dependent methyltransferase [Flavihumibacter profundi]MBZ5858880.1 1-acyl-sn-glycerol-3-phosphate acyltransferase [Flavihumibacter profundi]